jgi:hypothetical protein
VESQTNGVFAFVLEHLTLSGVGTSPSSAARRRKMVFFRGFFALPLVLILAVDLLTKLRQVVFGNSQSNPGGFLCTSD